MKINGAIIHVDLFCEIFDKFLDSVYFANMIKGKGARRHQKDFNITNDFTYVVEMCAMPLYEEEGKPIFAVCVDNVIL